MSATTEGERLARLEAVAAISFGLEGDETSLAELLARSPDHEELALALVGLAGSVLYMMDPVARTSLLEGWRRAVVTEDT